MVRDQFSQWKTHGKFIFSLWIYNILCLYFVILHSYVALRRHEKAGYTAISCINPKKTLGTRIQRPYISGTGTRSWSEQEISSISSMNVDATYSVIDQDTIVSFSLVETVEYVLYRARSVGGSLN
jgi:hypothetical protein